MNRYRIEYAEKGIPGILCKYVTGTEELLSVLLKLKYFDKLKSFDNVKVYLKKTWHPVEFTVIEKKPEKNLTFLPKFGII